MKIERSCKTCKHSGSNNKSGEYCDKKCSVRFYGDLSAWELFNPTHTTKTIDSIYAIRELGRDYCQTEGSTHYKTSVIEPAEYAMANDTFEDWAITNVVKYITRFKITRNKDDLKKVADFAHLLCGIEIKKED